MTPPIDPTPYLGYGIPGLVALIMAGIFGLVLAVVIAVLTSERIRMKATLEASETLAKLTITGEENRSKTALTAEAARDQLLIGAMDRSASALEKVNLSVGLLDQKLAVHVHEDERRLAVLENLLRDRQ